MDVRAGRRELCRVHLSDGAGQCSLPAGDLAPGSYEVVARYRGDADFAPSTSNREHLAVLWAQRRAHSATALSLSRSVVSGRREAEEEFSVSVSPAAQTAEVPEGTVDVRAGWRELCRVHLSDGAGQCSLPAWELAPGSYEVVARYRGDADFAPSTSAGQQLFVRRH